MIFHKMRPEAEADLSLARLLAASLTDPETRGEWAIAPSVAVMGFSRVYRNAARDLTVTRWASLYSSGLSAPFRLSAAGKKIVEQATLDFDRHLKLEREKAALLRLIAPAQGIEAATAGETTKIGSTEGESAGRKATLGKDPPMTDENRIEPGDELVERVHALRDALLIHTGKVPGIADIDWADVVHEYHAALTKPRAPQAGDAETALFLRRQWGQEQARAERLENENRRLHDTIARLSQ